MEVVQGDAVTSQRYFLLHFVDNTAKAIRINNCSCDLKEISYQN